MMIRMLTFAVLSCLAVAASGAPGQGEPAPGFELVDQYMKPHRLEDYAGKWVVLYFYPKDDTPGCTTEACNFRDDIYEIKALGAEVVGISLDTAESHAHFAEKHGLPFPLLSDADGVVAEKYGCLAERAGFRYAQRHTFILDPDGRIAKVYRDVDPKSHSGEIIADLKALTSAGS